MTLSLCNLAYSNNRNCLSYTSVGGSDFTAGPYQVMFTATQSRQTFTIGITDDSLAEMTEMFQLMLTPSGMITVGRVDTATITIMDNESQSTICPIVTIFSIVSL